jgi:DNA-directed RNA polymerase specialized sigma24 family protein
VPDADAERFTRVYRADYQRVLGYALRRASPEAAREAADETFLIAWRRLPVVPEPALPWLLVTARNVLSAQRRTGLRGDALLAEVARVSDALFSTDLSQEIVERTVVLQALAALPEAYRDALMLTVWDGLGHRDAARAADCSVGAFAVRLHRARRRLRTELTRLDGLGATALPSARMEAG